MVLLLAAIATDAEHMPSLLYSLRGVMVPPEPKVEGETWGVGYFADGHALTIRKPGELVTARNFYELAGSVRSRVLMALVQRGQSKNLQAPPHRFRRWLFGGVGDLSALNAVRGKIVDAVPDFIRTEVGDQTAGELAFGMFLRELQKRNLLSDPLVDGPSLAEAMKRTTEAMNMLAAEAGIEPPRASFAATNGRTVIVARGKNAPPIHWKRQEGLEMLPDGPIPPSLGDPQQVADALKRFRAVVFGAELKNTPPDWKEIGEARTLWVDRTLTVNEAHG